MYYMHPRSVLIAGLLCFLAYGPAVQAADELRYLYQWKDDQGVVNVTDNLDKVPPKYRSKATQLLQPGVDKEEQRSSGDARKEQPRNVDAGSSLDRDEIRKAEWQQKMLDAKNRLAVAEEQYSRLEQRKNDILSRTGSSGAALPTQEMLDEMNSLTGELAKAKVDVDNARNEVEVNIPDQARRAGIPPGWLREVQ
jgi:chromosome segregation ATPase